MLSLCKSFVSQLPDENGKVAKATYMNRSIEALKEESVNVNTFETTSAAIKRRATGTMTTIKLDKNFDINVHGGEQYIERGYDEERGIYYYQLFFREER